MDAWTIIATIASVVQIKQCFNGNDKGMGYMLLYLKIYILYYTHVFFHRHYKNICPRMENTKAYYIDT